jgi:hypothetical protein
VKHEDLHTLVQDIFNSHDDNDPGCEDCGCHLDRIAELVAHGADLHTLLPEVEAHLRCCRDCREEFEALVAMIKAAEANASSDILI